MTILDLIRALAEDAPIGIVVTDTMIDAPGPTIHYANPAFARLVGRSLETVIGQSPRFMQGKETREEILDTFKRALASGNRFHGYLTNYRGDGTKYRVEIDCRPLYSVSGEIEGFISFEREVIRRVGRPASGVAGRYEPISASGDALTSALRTLSVFEEMIVERR
ncbi:PAS domain-containing protein [Methylobacterium sp. J-088]|uniref:PAS domain-containing protein n=1 Tax=Methylobacterium sp. J-088 TaxID=2836664 RepID=UPI001FB9655A|nr:PAS domain-containing protein [Methylobacterium sp. J-088]MCJ2061152.1 PAS domain-containing protein [Methylobacterium sp. J-088]